MFIYGHAKSRGVTSQALYLIFFMLYNCYMKFDLPLRVKVSKNKYFILNLNNYRNAHHRILSASKRNYGDIVYKLLHELGYSKERFRRIKVWYRVYPPSKRLYDGNNPVSIIDKYLMDAIVNMGIIPDDNVKHVECYDWRAMSPDKTNPRVEVYIEDKTKNKNKYFDYLKKVYKS